MRVGAKVVCINDRFPDPDIVALYTDLPRKGTIYIVRGVELGVNAKGEEGEVAVTLVGLYNPLGPPPASRERAFSSERFREIDDPVEKAIERERQKDPELIPF
jgi:hypothetical protein